MFVTSQLKGIVILNLKYEKFVWSRIANAENNETAERRKKIINQ